MTRARDIANLGNNTTNLETLDTLYGDNVLTGRNLIINGAMQVWQRATAATTATNDAYSTVDRFKFFNSNDGAYTTEQSTTAPSSEGFTYSLKAVVTTADTSIGATQYAAISQYIEAQNLQHLGYGTSSAKSLTLSFWVRSNKTGTYTIALEKSDSTLYRYVKEYSISTADTWEKKTITIEPDSQIKASAGAIDNDNGYGIRVFWNLIWGSTFNGATDGVWSSNSSDYATSNQVNWMDTLSNDFYLTGVQLEVGQTATPFEHRSYGEELARCQRYFFNFPDAAYNIHAAPYTASISIAHFEFPVTMRTLATMVITDGAGTSNSTGISPEGFHHVYTDVYSNFISTFTADAEL